MANYLKMAKVSAILTLREHGLRVFWRYRWWLLKRKYYWSDLSVPLIRLILGLK